MDIAADSLNPHLNATAPATVPPSGADAARPFERKRVLHAAVDLATPEQIISHLTHCIDTGQGCSVAGVSGPYATAMADDAALRDAFLQADLLIPDGKGFAWGARMLGVDCGERIAIPDLCDALLQRGDEAGWKVFIYGATEEINAAACANLRQRYPGLKAVAGQHGYNQGAAEEDTVIERLKSEQFNLLIVARPSPDKEKFLARCCKTAGVVGLAAGGYADILAGRYTRAPRFVQALGCEWLYRVMQEPGRLWKRVGWANARFASSILWAHLFTRATPWWGNALIQALLIATAVIVAYVFALNAPYHFDDPDYVSDNPTIHSFEALSKITVLAHRKVWWISNAICYKLSEAFGNHAPKKPDVRIFRAWNIACHLIGALALFGLLRRCMRTSGLTTRGPTGKAKPYDLIAFAAAAIYGAHPLCTEGVTYISGRDNGQGGMFYLLGLYFATVTFDRMQLGRAPALEQNSHKYWPGWMWPLVLALAMGGCSVLTKESYLTFPVAIGLVYFVYFRGSQRRTVSAGLFAGILVGMIVLAISAAGRRNGYLAPALLAALFSTAAGAILGDGTGGLQRSGYRAWLQRRIDIMWALFAAVAGIGIASIVAFPYAYQRVFAALLGHENSNFIRSLASQAYAIPWMLLRTIAPYGLNIDHDFPTIDGFSDSRAIVGGAIIASLIAFGIFGARRGWLGSFGVLFALITIFPTNSIIERGDIVSERNFYLAAAGGACFLAWLIALLPQWLAQKLAARSKDADPRAALNSVLNEAGLWTGVMACCITAPFVSLTLLRNYEWGDALRLWTAAYERSPKKVRVLYNYGLANYMRKRYDEADTAFTNIIAIGEAKAEKNLFRADENVEIKCFHLAYANLARMHLRRFNANPEQGIRVINRVEEIFNRGLERTAFDPDLAFTYAEFLMQLGRPYAAQPVLQKSLNLHLWADQLNYPLGLANLELNEFNAAVHYLTKALGLRELHPLGVSEGLSDERISDVYAYRGLAHICLRNKAAALADLRMSLELDPRGVLVMFQGSTKVRNLKRNPIKLDPPDPLVVTLSWARFDLLEVTRQACDQILAAQNKTDPTLVRMLRNLLQRELDRRDAVQQKRIKFEFKDDPDEEHKY